ncbi:MAG: hypothetical protein Unbinned6805contig1000_23 [Prokaryotic dsDNA virus sp.]|nr:MAG: hypothetical protein Unbinned6805contig1000_23 [Prokaryotic dsDNA virus sp.]|tara:strand:- start:28419 stop:28670 length:252 start_codon:yes stop_codon:yes gene_type:complete
MNWEECIDRLEKAGLKHVVKALGEEYEAGNKRLLMSVRRGENYRSVSEFIMEGLKWAGTSRGIHFWVFNVHSKIINMERNGEI